MGAECSAVQSLRKFAWHDAFYFAANPGALRSYEGYVSEWNADKLK
jgi:hypothetical protein